jgi:uncharacterized protein with FMN-binding domain
VTSVSATEYPTASRTDRAINAYAIPLLESDAVGTTDGKVKLISGATYTSRGFAGSLQDAINQAKA